VSGGFEMRIPSLMLCVCGALVLGGCQTPGARADDDNVGRLGEVVRPGPGTVYVELATEYFKGGQYALALTNAKKAVRLEPSNPTAHNILALIYQRLGDNALAEQHFQRAVALDPRDPYALNAYGTFLCAAKRYEEARQHFNRALDNPLNTEPWVPLTNAGACALEQGDKAGAESYLRRALQANHRFAPALLRMAKLSFAQHNYLSCRAYLQRYEEVAAHTPETLWLGIQTERELGDKDQLGRYEMTLRAKFPDSEQVRYLKEPKHP